MNGRHVNRPAADSPLEVAARIRRYQDALDALDPLAVDIQGDLHVTCSTTTAAEIHHRLTALNPFNLPRREHRPRPDEDHPPCFEPAPILITGPRRPEDTRALCDLHLAAHVHVQWASITRLDGALLHVRHFVLQLLELCRLEQTSPPENLPAIRKSQREVIALIKNTIPSTET